MDGRESTPKFPWLYFGLAFLLAVPFWVFGERKLPLVVNLPVSAIGFIGPVTAGAIYTYRQSGQGGVDTLLRRVIDLKQIKNAVWLAVALGLMPVIFLLA